MGSESGGLRDERLLILVAVAVPTSIHQLTRLSVGTDVFTTVVVSEKMLVIMICCSGCSGGSLLSGGLIQRMPAINSGTRSK